MSEQVKPAENRSNFGRFKFTFDGLYIHNARSRTEPPFFEKDSVYASVGAGNTSAGIAQNSPEQSLGNWGSNSPVQFSPFSVEAPYRYDDDSIQFSVAIVNKSGPGNLDPTSAPGEKIKS
jgi:hypothetical protein